MNTFERISIRVNGDTTAANSGTAGLRPGQYTLSNCTCCPEHLFWRYQDDESVCGRCIACR